MSTHRGAPSPPQSSTRTGSDRKGHCRRQIGRLRYAVASRTDTDEAVHTEAAVTPRQTTQVQEGPDQSRKTESRM